MVFYFGDYIIGWVVVNRKVINDQAPKWTDAKNGVPKGSVSSSSFDVSAKDVLPLPKVPSSTGRPNRPRDNTMILTESPDKARLFWNPVVQERRDQNLSQLSGAKKFYKN